MALSSIAQSSLSAPSLANRDRKAFTAPQPAPQPPQRCRRQCRRRRQSVAAAAGAAAAAPGPLADAALTVAAAGGDGMSWVLPAVGAGVVLAGVAALRLSTYSQLEYVTAAMLARHVKKDGARVLQLGGTTRDIFYYPAGTVQVTVGGPDVTPGLWEQAGMQAKVPVVPVKQDTEKILSSQAGSTVDSLVLLNQMGQWADAQQLLSQVMRVLKPGGTFIFVQRLRGGPLQPLLGGSAGAVDASLVDAVQQYAGWDFVQWDAALEGSDPHAVGVAIKPLAAGGRGPGAEGSVDKVAFEQLMKRKKRQQEAAGQQQQQAGGGFSKA